MRLIDADELLRLSHRFHISEFDRDGFEIIYADTVRNAPTVEVQKTGRWIECDHDKWVDGVHGLRCSECNGGYHLNNEITIYYWNYCPSCGARMECEEE